MMLNRIARAAALAVPLSLCATAFAQPTPEGFLCCNMRTDGKWISDINYAESGKRVIPVGTPVKVTGYGRQRVYVELEGDRQAIGNDYSRELDLGTFAQRYVVSEDPRRKIAAFAPKVRDAIAQARVMKGMTREQVLMAVGYPVTSENPSLEQPLWRYWLSSFAEFQLSFDEKGHVSSITTDPQTRNLVVME